MIKVNLPVYFTSQGPDDDLPTTLLIQLKKKLTENPDEPLSTNVITSVVEGSELDSFQEKYKRKAQTMSSSFC